MAKDAIEGATYYDGTFDEEFVITDVSSDMERVENEDEVDLTLDYDDLGEVRITLAQFRADASIETVEVPE